MVVSVLPACAAVCADRGSTLLPLSLFPFAVSQQWPASSTLLCPAAVSRYRCLLLCLALAAAAACKDIDKWQHAVWGSRFQSVA